MNSYIYESQMAEGQVEGEAISTAKTEAKEGAKTLAEKEAAILNLKNYGVPAGAITSSFKLPVVQINNL